MDGQDGQDNRSTVRNPFLSDYRFCILLRVLYLLKEMAMFVDAHLHAARKKGLPRNAADSNYTTPEELIAMMDRAGVDRGILLPLISPESSFQLSTTEDVLEVCAAYSHRFYAFCNVDPRAGAHTPEADLFFHLNYYKHQGCLGVGEITADFNGLTRDPEFGWSFMERFSYRILFGTAICDPLIPHRHADYLRTSFAEGRISRAAFDNISWRNANRLFGLGL